MRNRSLLLAAMLLTTPAMAQDQQAPPKLHLDCMPLARFLQNNKEAGDQVINLSPGQFHFMVGVYVGSPSTPEGLPPGDGAILVSRPRFGDHAFVVWTRDKKLACNPLEVPAKLLQLMADLKAGRDNADTL